MTRKLFVGKELILFRGEDVIVNFKTHETNDLAMNVRLYLASTKKFKGDLYAVSVEKYEEEADTHHAREHGIVFIREYDLQRGIARATRNRSYKKRLRGDKGAEDDI